MLQKHIYFSKSTSYTTWRSDRIPGANMLIFEPAHPVALLFPFN